MTLTAMHLRLMDSPKTAGNETQRHTSLQNYRTSRLLCGGLVLRSLFCTAGLGPTRHSGASFARIARPLSAKTLVQTRTRGGCQAIGVGVGKAANLSAAVFQGCLSRMPMFCLCGSSLDGSYSALRIPSLRHVRGLCFDTPPFVFSLPQQEILRSLCTFSLARWIKPKFFLLVWLGWSVPRAPPIKVLSTYPPRP